MRYTILIILAIFGTLLSSIVPSLNQPVWYAQYLGLLFFLCLGVSVFIWNFNKYLSIISAMCLLSAFFVTQLSPRAIVLLFQFNFSLLACYGISKLDKKQRNIIVWAVFASVLLQYVWVTLQWRGIDPIFKSLTRPGQCEMVGFNGAKDQLGSFFAITFPIVLKCFPQMAVLSLMGICASKSSFAFVSAVVSGLVYLFFTNKKYFKIFILSLAIPCVLFFGQFEKLRPADFITRMSVWEYSVKSTIRGSIDIANNQRKMCIKTNPIWGYGLGNFLRIFPFVPEVDGYDVDNKPVGGVGRYNTTPSKKFNYIGEKFEHAHNDYVEYFFEFGWAGLAVLLLFFYGLFHSFYMSIKQKELAVYFSCLIAYFLNASGNFLTHLGMSGLFLILFYSLYRSALDEK